MSDLVYYAKRTGLLWTGMMMLCLACAAQDPAPGMQQGPTPTARGAIDLPSSKQLLPGTPGRRSG